MKKYNIQEALKKRRIIPSPQGHFFLEKATEKKAIFSLHLPLRLSMLMKDCSLKNIMIILFKHWIFERWQIIKVNFQDRAQREIFKPQKLLLN